MWYAAMLLVGVVLGLLVTWIALRGRTHVDLSPVTAQLDSLQSGQERMERSVRDEIVQARKEAGEQAGGLRQEVTRSLVDLGKSLVNGQAVMSKDQQTQLDLFSQRLANLTDSVERKLEAVRTGVDAKLGDIQKANDAKLEEMRKTVDEKLQSTLDRRLSESFKLVSERLEAVHKGLGDMQSLAAGVGDLKKVLANVKVRGTWGEIQLGSLLEQLLAPEQYFCNVVTKEGSAERVEFAINLPGQSSDDSETVLLPIDAKFPWEDYQRLVVASENSDLEAIGDAGKQLEFQIKRCAKDIRDKYLNPPRTTDFGLMFLPSEGLYAEVLRRPGLAELLQREYRVVVAGPTTLAALLNALQMGFRTLAIQKRSSEVWNILAAVKTEFGKFGEVISKVHKKLEEASNTIEGVAARTKAIDRKLREVQELPTAEAARLLETPLDAQLQDPMAQDAAKEEVEK